jgi:hypothetical protein
MLDTTIRWILGILFTLICGSYGFSWTSTSNLEDRTVNKLQRIEDKLDRVIERIRY